MIVYATYPHVSMVSYCNYISKPKLCCPREPVKSSIQSENMLARHVQLLQDSLGHCSIPGVVRELRTPVEDIEVVALKLGREHHAP